MDFKKWLLSEVVELNKPTGRVKKSNVVKGAGVHEREVIQYKWTTQKGNVVKLFFEPKGDDNSYEISFYVNDSIKDDAKSPERDVEILSSVFYLIKNKADKLGAEKLSWWAEATDKDNKVIRDLEFDERVFFEELNKFKRAISTHPVKYLPTTQLRKTLFQKLGRDVPEYEPDIDTNRWIEWVNEVEREISNEKRPAWLSAKIEDFLKNIVNSGKLLKTLNYNVNDLIEVMKRYQEFLQSKTEQGLLKRTNRRLHIYRRLVDRYFSDDWNINISSQNRFELTRK